MKTQSPENPFIVLLVSIAVASLHAGCTGTIDPTLAAPHAASSNRPVNLVVGISPWMYGKSTSARVVHTPHYAIYTTIADRDLTHKLGQLMEAALAEYQKFTPGVKLSAKPLDCYVFEHRTEWAAFTQDQTGEDAALYLQINRGGYTVRDWYVAYFIGDRGTYAVAAHEGWHQYVARHFKSRLPPFLEEGIATMFENVRFESSPPRFNLSPRSHRVHKLRLAIENQNIWPLERLMTMHAGDVVSMPGPKIEAFYAQNWAFAEFLYDAEDGRYRPALQQLLADCASGTVYDGTTSGRRSIGDGWKPESVRPTLEHYLSMDLPAIKRAYQAYCRKIAFARHLDYPE